MRVAIVRLTSLGDVVHTLPVAHAIREHEPGAYVVWIAEEREQALLLGNPAVDEVIVGPTRRWRRELRTPGGGVRVLREWRALGERLRALALDVALDVQGLLKSTIFTVLTRAPMRVGFRWPHAREPLSALFTTHRVSPPRTAVHMVEKNLSLLAPLGIPVRDVRFPMPCFPAAEARAEALLHAHAVAAGDRLVALLPATRRAEKQWPAAAYRQLAARLAALPGVRVLVLAAPGEEAALEGVAAGVPGDGVVRATGPTPDFVALLRRAHVAIGNDTGPVHLAAALGVRTIGLYGPTQAAVNGPYGPRVRTVQSPSARMADIPVDAVYRAAADWLA